MPRTPRISWLHQPHLVIAYAQEGASLFFDHEDYVAYLQHLRQLVRDNLVLVYGYCLQQSELRLVLEPIRIPLARIMQRLHVTHVARLKARKTHLGKIFQNRFRSLLIPRSELSHVVRNVHLWPVRTGLVRRPEKYPYSSHASYIGAPEPFFDLLHKNEILHQHGSSLPVSQRAFARYVESAALDKEKLNPRSAGLGVASDDKEQALQLLHNEPQIKKKRRVSLPALAKKVALLLNVSALHMQSQSRQQDLVMARRLIATTAVLNGGRTVSEVAQFLARDKAQISRLVSQGLDLLSHDRPFKTLYDATIEQKSNAKSI